MTRRLTLPHLTSRQKLFSLAGLLVVLVAGLISLSMRRDGPPPDPPITEGYTRYQDPVHGVTRLDLPQSFSPSADEGIAQGLLAWYADDTNQRKFGYSANVRTESAEITPEIVQERILPKLEESVPGFTLGQVKAYSAGGRNGAGVTYEFTVADRRLIGSQVYIGVDNRLYTLYFVNLPADEAADEALVGILNFIALR